MSSPRFSRNVRVSMESKSKTLVIANESTVMDVKAVFHIYSES